MTSPSLADLRRQALKKFPKAKWTEYDPISRDNELAGTAMAYGEPLYVHPHFDQASVILSLDFDFLGLDSPSPFMTKLYSKGRRIDSEEDIES